MTNYAPWGTRRRLVASSILGYVFGLILLACGIVFLATGQRGGLFVTIFAVVLLILLTLFTLGSRRRAR